MLKNSRLFSTDKKGNQTWLTPRWILNSLGKFDLDPCGKNNWNTAKRIIELPECGLKAEWKNMVWLNPPFNEAGPWAKKMSEHKNGIMLIPAKLDTEWFHKCVFSSFKSMLVIRGRVQFLNEQLEVVTTGAYPIAICLVSYSILDSICLSNAVEDGKIKGKIIHG